MRAEQEITAIYERQADTVWRVCYSFMRNHADAQDMMHETFLRLIRSGVTFASEKHERAWLIVTASNVCKDALRHPERIPDALEDHPDLAAPEQPDSVLAEAILRLPTDYKEVIYLYYYEGYSTDEIAKMLGAAPSTVRSRLARARARLKEELEDKSDAG